jgi:hypothetical protein
MLRPAINTPCRFESLEHRMLLASSVASADAIPADFSTRETVLTALATSSVAGSVWTIKGPLSLESDGIEVLGGDGPASITFKSNHQLATDDGTFLQWQQAGNTITLSLDLTEARELIGGHSIIGVSYSKRTASVNGSSISGALDCTFDISVGSQVISARIDWSFSGKLKTPPGPSQNPAELRETWEKAASKAYTPISAEEDGTLIVSGDHTWIVNDTASEDGPSPMRAIIKSIGGSKGLRLETVDAGTGSANNLWVQLAEFGPYNKGFAVSLGTSSQIRFKAAGFLADPRVGSPANIFRPYGDTVAMVLQTKDGDQLAYVLARNAKRKPDTSTPHYREVFLDPAQGVYLRNLYKDFSTIPGFTSGSPIVSIAYQISDVGWATMDDLYIGGKAPNEAPMSTLAKLRQPSRSAKTYSFKVTYADETAVDAATLGGDIAVSGPHGFKQTATLTGKSVAAKGGIIVATYRIKAPGGTWNATDNGTYTFALGAKQVKDAAGNAAAARTLGKLKVVVPAAATSRQEPPHPVPAAQLQARPIRILQDISELL